MNYDLYFIAVIEKAFGGRAGKYRALRQAFDTIGLPAGRDDHKTGYRQFCHFMMEVGLWARGFSGPELERNLIERFRRPETITVTAERDGVLLETFRFAAAGGTKTLENIIPGSYRFMLDTGICLLGCRLTQADIIGGDEAGDDTLKMAADSQQQAPRAARSYSAFGGMIRFYLYAGLERGSIMITVDGKGVSSDG
jgi:hypothetical protein